MAGSPSSSLPALSPASSMNQYSEETGQLVCQTTSFTHKQWVIPPRPKPGRKPATDVPPTKRKAQNRAAQRAFRERRAAKVEELEEQMKEKETERLKERNDLISEIGRLEAEVERFRGEVLAWQSKSQELERGLERERSWREGAEREMLKRRATSDPAREVHLLRSQQGPSRGQSIEGAVMDQYEMKDDELPLIGCGKCTDSRCECLEEAINMSTKDFMPSNLDHARKQLSSGDGTDHGSENLQGRSNSYMEDATSLETDYTALFASNAPKGTTARTQRQPSPARIMTTGTTATDPCGFCQDGTPCICAQMECSRPAGVAASARPSNVMSRFTPPPADGDVCQLVEPTSKITRGQADTPSNPCAGGPGTCAQCRVDPNSTIFCKSLAATQRPSVIGPERDAGCCKSQSGSSVCRGRNVDALSQPSQYPPASSAPGSSRREGTAYLSCADTYITLSRHPHYQRATDELDTWLGKLKTTLPTGEADRPAIEIEAASVMGVLKLFDRRFGRE